MAHKLKRYEHLAEQIADMIRAGVLAVNERVPSVRQASERYGVSPATVFRAYYLLEDRGLIQARERSGYYVRPQGRPRLAETAQPHLPSAATDVGVSELVFSVLGSLRDPATVPFGSAFPGPGLFPLGPLARSMGRAVQRLSPHAIIADMTAGNPDLARHILQRYRLSGATPAASELVITNGAMEALNLCLQAVTQPGDLVAIESPAFYASLQVLERLKLRAVEIPVRPGAGMDLDALAHSLDCLPIKACWLMSNFQNPMGATLAEADKVRLCDLLARQQVPLIEDDVYAELYFGSTPPRPVKSFDREGWVMHCSSFSKSLAPGYRVGWAAAGRFADSVTRLKLMTTLSPSVPAQAAIADYLQHGGYDRHLRKLRHALEDQQRAMLDAAARYFPAQTRVTQPNGGYFLWFEFPRQVNALALFHDAFAQGISLAPGPMFSATQGFGHCIRLNYGNPWDSRCEAAMEALGKLLAQQVAALQ
ncbi:MULTISPECIES: PLP-dependent aminotransferase family protein [Pseudomonas]|uniref:PLP-dependent aminotransferase family protein n=1 Tax=Pseudomonas quercus TaxID=2722792 RepID=A0ABX0Y929_9PSED|nr:MULTISPECIES: PLP-dependent aminotransferase family protein [Pseudomonas]MBF7141299.1 PLP-dependent aminotransferase family protein [Pseudomonas sp. LY10J]NJO99832.1 PLP-dependent aminotransferase family protein [Pseudomonas quercus]